MILDLLLSRRINLMVGLVIILTSVTFGFTTTGNEGPQEIGTVKVYPNPILDENVVSVEFEKALTGNLKYSIIDQIGNQYLKMEIKIEEPIRKIAIDLSRYNLGPGIYFLRIKNDLKPEKVLKIIKK